MKCFWFSFSYEGVNQGCCNVEANSLQEARAKIIKLKLVPVYDDVLELVGEESELELNKFYSRQELVKLGYLSNKQLKELK